MELKKIEAVLNTLGYAEGTIEKIKVEETIDGVDISFHVNKLVKMYTYKIGTVDEDTLLSQEPEKDSKDKNFLGNTQFPIKLCQEKEEKPKRKYHKKVEGEYIENPNKSVWRTPVPQTRTRYVLFKDKKAADKFTSDYLDEFELRETDMDKEGITRCELIHTKPSDFTYYDGYPWCLSFRMNGAAFEVLENCEGLRKKKDGKRGGACIRVKD